MQIQPNSYQGTRRRPAWSPDGSKFAAEVERDIVVVSADGQSTLGTIGPAGRWSTNPSFSPDGTKIAYATYDYLGHELPTWSLQVADADGSNPQVLNKNLGWSPQWSADGSLISYTGNDENERGYYTWVTTPDGKQDRRLTPDYRGLETERCWDPKGQEMVVSSFSDDGQHLVVRDTTGQKERQITYNPGFVTWDQMPNWSPDGSTIVFEQHWKGGGQLAVVDPYGDDVKPFVDLGVQEYEPVFSPDGQYVAFTAGRQTGDFDLYVARADGSEVRRLTHQAGDEYLPSWSPDGTKIAFLTFDHDMNDGCGVVEFHPKAGELVQQKGQAVPA